MDLTPQTGEFEAVVAFFSLLMLPRAEIPAALARFREVLVPGGWLLVGMVEADADDLPIPFLGAQVLVSGYSRQALKDVLAAAGFTVRQGNALSYAPAAPGLPPETQLTFRCQLTAG
jgi:hypothetical protein